MTEPKTILEQCSEITRLSELATLGPWIPSGDYVAIEADPEMAICQTSIPFHNGDSDRDLIAASRTFAPAAAEILPKLAEALEIGESWMKHTIEDTEWSDDEKSKAHHENAKAELSKVRAALALLNQKHP